MKLHAKKAFTLVEMLIVVVIIGILAAALIPRMMSAIAKSRDTARKTDLNQIMWGMFSYYSDEGAYTGNATMCADDVEKILEDHLDSVPRDPQWERLITFANNGTDDGCTKAWSYGIIAVKRNGSDFGGLVLAANTENPGKSSNFVLLADGGAIEDSGVTDTDCDGGENTICMIPDLEVSDLDNQLCEDGVEMDTDGTATNCAADGVREWKATADAAMVYIITK